MSGGLRVSPWKRYGHDRLYVSLPGGKSVAWLDRRNGELHILVEEYRSQAQSALSSYLEGKEPMRATAAPRPVPEGTAAEDLAANRPGRQVQDKLAEVSQGAWRELAARLLGRRTEASAWRAGLVGEEIVGAELRRLERFGWHALHSIPLARNVDVDHLLMGPGGVFSINTKHHRKARVWVGDESARINHGKPQPYVRKARAEAARVTRALTLACGFPVQVHPVLAIVGATEIRTVPSLLDVRVVTARQLSAFRPLKGALAPSELAKVYAAARDPRTWAKA
ncbi:nuclease-related domain-containing protein [Streptomyces sp. NPDC050658]|uniref:nuclease-related domain-containing protein n=1 Tax=unclassified Streptomyces TaxID=2593676 RepID=UPI0034289EB8